MKTEIFENIQFFINNSGFPLDQVSFDKMINFSKYVNFEDKDSIENLFKIPINQKKYPDPPLTLKTGLKLSLKIEQIQDYMRKLEYNHTGIQFCSIKSNRHLNGLMENAREIIRNSLPIKCLEAVILGIYLTNGISHLERFTIGFRSLYNGLIFKHVVLGLYSNGLYGAIGMSRRKELMYKPLHFTSLASLILNFIKAYHEINHSLQRISLGEIISHDPCSLEPISWKGKVLHLPELSTAQVREEIEKYSKKLRKQATFRGLLHPNYLPCLPKYHHESTMVSRKPIAKKDCTVIYFQHYGKGPRCKSRSKSTEYIRV